MGASCCFVAGGIVSVIATDWFRRGRNFCRRCREESKSGTSTTSSNSSVNALTRKQYPELLSTTRTKFLPKEIREEQLSRHTLYFGREGMMALSSSRVCVVGLGGVGSHVAMMLARGGVALEGHLRLIDFDQVTLSSLNRHACATLQDVGTPKVICVQKACQALGVYNIDARVEMYTTESGPNLLSLENNIHAQDGNNNKNIPKWNFVIDCIDDVPTKAALLAYCIQSKIRVLSCMGAGGKSDVTRLHISDLRTASRDPLASKLRQTMKKTMMMSMVQEASTMNDSNPPPSRNGRNMERTTPDTTYLDDMDQLTIIYSSEKPVMKLAELTEEQQLQNDKSQFGPVDGMRIRVLPVLGPLPAIMGQSLAAIALCELGNKPIHQPVTGERVGKNVRHKIYQHLMTREQRLRNGELKLSNGADSYTGPLEIDHDDVEYLLGVWRNRCGVTGSRLGTTLSLVRWDTNKPARVDNLVLMCTQAMKAFDESGRDSVPINIQKRIEDRLARCRDLNAEF